jgi:hypothetical protein
MSQRKRNPGAIRDLESIVNPATGDITTTGSITAASLTVTGNTAMNGNATVSGTLTVGGSQTVNGNLTVTGSITMAGTQIRHPVQFGPYLPTASSVQLVTDIASWPNKIEMTVNGISLNGTCTPILQLKTSTGTVTSGYLGSLVRIASGVVDIENHSNGFKFAIALTAAGSLRGMLGLQRHGTATSNIWGFTAVLGRSDTIINYFGGGTISLPGPLTGFELNTATGTQVYDAGEIAGFYRY